MIIQTSNPILVTGSHRSGSTWAGKMLSLAPETGYIHEPFNPEISVYKYLFTYWFTYICEENEEQFEREVKECLQFKYNTLQEVKTIGSFKDVGRVVRDNAKFISCRFQKKRPLMKDPISLFSAEWLYKKFNMDVLILIRHPAAFVGSLKKGNTAHPFDHFLSQKLLMKKHLSNFEREIKKYSTNSYDIIDQGILLWNIIHSIILDFKKVHREDWLFLKHEDLSRQPIKEFKKVYDKFDLTYNETIENKIYEYSSGSNDNRNGLMRNSASNIWTWKNRLTAKEIAKIKTNCQETWKEFYSEEDW